jgi:hypothetical protein
VVVQVAALGHRAQEGGERRRIMEHGVEAIGGALLPERGARGGRAAVERHLGVGGRCVGGRRVGRLAGDGGVGRGRRVAARGHRGPTNVHSRWRARHDRRWQRPTTGRPAEARWWQPHARPPTQRRLSRYAGGSMATTFEWADPVG